MPRPIQIRRWLRCMSWRSDFTWSYWDIVYNNGLRATCGGSFSCPSPDGLVQVFVNGQPYREFEANTHVREGTTQTDIPIIPGMPYSIHAVGAGKSITWEYELGNIQGDCSGRDTCNAVMKLSGDKVTVNFHYCFRHCWRRLMLPILQKGT